MGHKVHPTGFRVGVIYDWQSKWYAGNKGYKVQLHEDVAIRNRIMGKGQPDAGNLGPIEDAGELIGKCLQIEFGRGNQVNLWAVFIGHCGILRRLIPSPNAVCEAWLLGWQGFHEIQRAVQQFAA